MVKKFWMAVSFSCIVLVVLTSSLFASEEGFIWAEHLPLWEWLSSFQKTNPALIDFTTIDAVPVAYATLVSLLIIVLALIARFVIQFKVIPSATFHPGNVFELITEGVLYLSTDIIGPRGKQFLPLLGTVALFILFSNILGLVPGFIPSTSNININLGMAVVVFIVYNYWGFKAHGIGYLKHFMGPVLWLTPLYMSIEIITNVARILTLSVRLFGNMTGDHLVLSMFSKIVPFLAPIAPLALGLFVCFIQTLIFVLLSTMYIALAIEKSEH